MRQCRILTDKKEVGGTGRQASTIYNIRYIIYYIISYVIYIYILCPFVFPVFLDAVFDSHLFNSLLSITSSKVVCGKACVRTDGPLRVPFGDDWVGFPLQPDFSPSRLLFWGLRLETVDWGAQNQS